MGRQKHTAKHIIGRLREAEVLQGKGIPMEEILSRLGISGATYYKRQRQVRHGRKLISHWHNDWGLVILSKICKLINGNAKRQYEKEYLDSLVCLSIVH